MSWGDVWVSAESVRPSIGAQGPTDPWVLAGAIGREEKAFVEATHRLRNTRDSHARAVDFNLQILTPDVARSRDAAKSRTALTFEPNGLWVAVELTPAGGDDGLADPRFAVFTQRVHATTSNRRLPAPAPGRRRALAVVALRARARSGASALEWGYRAQPR